MYFNDLFSLKYVYLCCLLSPPVTVKCVFRCSFWWRGTRSTLILLSWVISCVGLRLILPRDSRISPACIHRIRWPHSTVSKSCAPSLPYAAPVLTLMYYTSLSESSLSAFIHAYFSLIFSTGCYSVLHSTNCSGPPLW